MAANPDAIRAGWVGVALAALLGGCVVSEPRLTADDRPAPAPGSFDVHLNGRFRGIAGITPSGH